MNPLPGYALDFPSTNYTSLFITTYVACYTASLNTETDLSQSDCSIRVSRIIDARAQWLCP